MTARMPYFWSACGRVLARGAAAEVRAGEQDRRALEARLVQRVRLVRAVRVLADVVEEELAEPVKGDALQVARRDDAVGVDVVAGDVDGAAGDAGDFFECHGRVGFGLSWTLTPKTSRASATEPVTAAAATMTGLMRIVRPVGLPWRPLKLRLDELAQSWSPTSLSGFMARHIEQPASRHSKPGVAEDLVDAQLGAEEPTPCEPGTAIAFTPGGHAAGP